MSYTINLPVFEGPFDLLLHLVKVNEMDISDINIAEITDQYLKTIHLMQTLDLEVAGDFLVMAATLINLKVKSLLPELPAEGEGEEEGEEISDIVSAKALMQQLVEYRKYKELSVDLGGRQEEQMRLFFRNTLFNVMEKTENDAPLRSDLSLLVHCFSRVLRYVDQKSYHDVAFEPFSVEQRIGMFRERLKTQESMELFSLFQDCRSKVDAIVTFLALLELSRLKQVRLEQSSAYAEVYIFRRDPENEAAVDAEEETGGRVESIPTYAARSNAAQESNPEAASANVVEIEPQEAVAPVEASAEEETKPDA